MASGMARGAAARGKRIAFGNGAQIIWDHNSEEIFRYNPNIAPPGAERDRDIEWVHFYRGCRIYNSHDQARRKWIWNYKFRPIPGEITFSTDELVFAEKYGSGFILIEPYVPFWKVGAINKQWPIPRYTELARSLSSKTCQLVQLIHSRTSHLPYTRPIRTTTFRMAMAVLSRAALYVGPEGGLHHAAAALGIPAVVIFGSWIPPQVTGYDQHTNLSYGKPCGELARCHHCSDAMKQITVEMVLDAVRQELRKQELTNATADNRHMALGGQV